MDHRDISHASQATFDSQVLAASAQTPVLVDFWAEWCGPCKSLAPVLEQLVDKLDGKLKVVKVDTDAEQSLAASFSIRSLPTLMLFRDGKPVDQLMGAQALSALEAFVAPWLPRATDALLASANSAVEEADRDSAIQQLEQALQLDAGDYRIHALLGTLYIDAGRHEDARALLSDLPVNIAVDKSFDTLKARLSMADAGGGGEQDADPVGQAFAAAIAHANGGDYDAGVSALLGLLPTHREWRDGAISQSLVDIFKVLDDDPRVRGWRRQMARVLN